MSVPLTAFPMEGAVSYSSDMTVSNRFEMVLRLAPGPCPLGGWCLRILRRLNTTLFQCYQKEQFPGIRARARSAVINPSLVWHGMALVSNEGKPHLI